MSTLKAAAWILIALGVYETGMLVWAVASDESFSGGAFLYIIAGIFLFKKNTKDYHFLLFLFSALFSLIPAGIALFGLMALQINMATDIPLSWGDFGLEMIEVLIDIGFVIALVALLHHPNTRETLSLKPYRGTIHTLYMSRMRFGSVIGVSMVFFILLGGPHILHNPYKETVDGIVKSESVIEKVGNIKRLELLSTSESNWHVISYWRVYGTNSDEMYRTDLGPDLRFQIEYYDP